MDDKGKAVGRNRQTGREQPQSGSYGLSQVI